MSIKEKFGGIKKKRMTKLLMVSGILIILAFNIAFLFNYTKTGKSITGNVVGTYDDLTTKVVCKQQPYEDLEYYYEEVPYEDAEHYTEIVSGKNCDSVSGCYCIHKSWGGLGACDSCKCSKERTITKYKSVKKSRTITKFQEVCVEIRKWKKVDYNENWLNYPEIYNRDGVRIVNEYS